MMKLILRQLCRIARDEDGPTAVEYAVMLALILMVALGGIGAVGARTDGLWGGIRAALRAVGVPV